ncbi:putative F-box domain-containing protein [Helianthus annuus]|nr:putative F-box domain-containing protein [Helianthus annuus]
MVAKLPSENMHSILSTLNSKKPFQSAFKSITMAELPSEIRYDILSRIPVKSLVHCRCVSKQWRNYINDPYFETMYAKRAAVINDPTIIMFRQSPSNVPNSPCTLSFLEYKEEAGAGSCTLKLNKKPPSMEFMCKRWNDRHPRFIVLGSCYGFLYSSQRHSNDACTFVVINPIRRECYELPPINTPLQFESGLGFDESTNSFKMVCVMANLHPDKEGLCTMVHVLGTGSWREIPQVPSHPMCGEGVFANGHMHWLTSMNVYCPIIRFDMKTEEFGVIKPPRKGPLGSYVHLVDLNGEVGFVYIAMNYSVEVWVLKERGWVMHCGFDQKPHLGCGYCSRGLMVLGLWNENGDILMTSYQGHQKLLVYNLKSDSLYESDCIGFERVGPVKDIRMYQSTLFSTRLFDQKPKEKK